MESATSELATARLPASFSRTENIPCGFLEFAEYKIRNTRYTSQNRYAEVSLVMSSFPQLPKIEYKTESELMSRV